MIALPSSGSGVFATSFGVSWTFDSLTAFSWFASRLWEGDCGCSVFGSGGGGGGGGGTLSTFSYVGGRTSATGGYSLGGGSGCESRTFCVISLCDVVTAGSGATSGSG